MDNEALNKIAPPAAPDNTPIKDELERLTAWLHKIGHKLEDIIDGLVDHADYIKTHPHNPHPTVAPVVSAPTGGATDAPVNAAPEPGPNAPAENAPATDASTPANGASIAASPESDPNAQDGEVSTGASTGAAGENGAAPVPGANNPA